MTVGAPAVAHQRRPIGIEPFEYLGMDGISGLDPFFVIGVTAIDGKFLMLGPIKIAKRPDRQIPGYKLFLFDERLEQSPSDDFESFFYPSRPP